jgi:hypothetical protein
LQWQPIATIAEALRARKEAAKKEEKKTIFLQSGATRGFVRGRRAQSNNIFLPFFKKKKQIDPVLFFSFFENPRKKLQKKPSFKLGGGRTGFNSRRGGWQSPLMPILREPAPWFPPPLHDRRFLIVPGPVFRTLD